MEKYGFFNSSGGDRIYDAADFAGYFGKLVSNGVFTKSADNLKVLAGGGMSIAVQSGSASKWDATATQPPSPPHHPRGTATPTSAPMRSGITNG